MNHKRSPLPRQPRSKKTDLVRSELSSGVDRRLRFAPSQASWNAENLPPHAPNPVPANRTLDPFPVSKALHLEGQRERGKSTRWIEREPSRGIVCPRLPGATVDTALRRSSETCRLLGQRTMKTGRPNGARDCALPLGPVSFPTQGGGKFLSGARHCWPQWPSQHRFTGPTLLSERLKP